VKFSNPEPEYNNVRGNKQHRGIRKMSEYQVKTTKEIKGALKKKFNHKFSVRQGKGTSSHYVDVEWLNGPTTTQVNEFCEQFNDTAKDEPQTDYYGGRQYTMTQRTVTAQEFIKVAERVCNKRDLRLPEIEVRVSYDKKYSYANVAEVDNYRVEDQGENIRNIAELIYSKVRNTDFRIKLVR
jgi:hypothetical protein